MSALDEVASCTSDSFQKVLGVVAAITLYGMTPRLLLPAKEQEACVLVIEQCSRSDFDKSSLRGKTIAEAVALLIDFARQHAEVRRATA